MNWQLVLSSAEKQIPVGAGRTTEEMGSSQFRIREHQPAEGQRE